MTIVVTTRDRPMPVKRSRLDQTRVRWWPPFVALLFAPAAGATLASAAAFVNLMIYDDFFRRGWASPDWASVLAEATRLGLMAGALFGFIYVAGLVAITRLRAPVEFAMGCLGHGALVVAIFWLLGGTLAWLTAHAIPGMWGSGGTVLPYAPPPPDLYGYAWVGGSMYGMIAGVVPALIVALLLVYRRWPRVAVADTQGFDVLAADVLAAGPPGAPASHADPATAADDSAPPANVV